jgi:hypothetical protein
MDCPNCGKEMKWSNMVIDTNPETRHTYCECGLVVDHCEGDRPKVCFQSRGFTQEQMNAINVKLGVG